MRTYPHHEQIVAKPLVGEEKTCGGLFELDDVEHTPLGARVVSVGSGKVLENGERVAFTVRPGDGVILRRNVGSSESGLNGESRIVIVDENDILVIFERSRA